MMMMMMTGYHHQHGYVVDVEADLLHIDFLRRSDAVTGCTFISPQHQDIAWVEQKQVLQKLSAPVIDKRNHPGFPGPIAAE